MRLLFKIMITIAKEILDPIQMQARDILISVTAMINGIFMHLLIPRRSLRSILIRALVATGMVVVKRKVVQILLVSIPF